MPAISVIVPVYKVEPYIHRCVDSILAQTFTDFELILVDDGSPDGCPAICDEYAAQDSRVRVIHKPNGGVSSARNAGIECARGEYLAFVDSDDYVDNDYLQTFWDNLSDLTLSGFITYNENDEKLYSNLYEDRDYKTPEEIDYIYLCDKLFSPYCRLFRKDIIKRFNIRFPLGITWGEDGMFVGEYVKHFQNARVLSYGGYHYIKYGSSDSLSTKVRPDIVDMISVSREYYLNCIEPLARENGNKVREIVLNDLRSNCVYFVIQLFYSTKMSKEDKKNALEHFLKSPHIKVTVQEKDHFYWDKNVRASLNKRNPISFYEYLARGRRLCINVYSSLPQFVRDYIRKMRKRNR